MDIRSIEVIDVLYKLKEDAYIALATLPNHAHRRYIEVRIAEIDAAIEKLINAWAAPTT